VTANRKYNILGILVDAADYEIAKSMIVAAAYEGRGFVVSALAVHGIMTGFLDPSQKYRLNRFDLIVADGQPVRWALNWLYGVGLRQRVYGPRLMLETCAEAARLKLPIFLYGSTTEVLDKLTHSIKRRFPKIQIAGTQSSKFRNISVDERDEIVNKIHASGARIVIVGLGCPRQEVWAYELREMLSLPVLAVGAAFPFHAGILRQAPEWMQRLGLEWLYRFRTEPRRLWRRYLLLNPLFLIAILFQRLGVRFGTSGREPSQEILCG
jgi:N-acetylglucosaminyldiphosphoundecaprenol N-acetyl-beta-D-mannosaminyltransferase